MGKKKMNNQTIEEAVEAANFDSDFEEVEETFEGEDRIEQQDSPSIFSE